MSIQTVLPEKKLAILARLGLWYAKFFAQGCPLIMSSCSPARLDAIVVLSGPGVDGNHREDDLRIQAAAEFYRQRLYFGCESVQFILNGATEQRQFMLEGAVASGVDANLARFVDAGPADIVNTRVQMEVLGGVLDAVDAAMFVSSNYHAGRVYLTARRQLPLLTTSVLSVSPDRDAEMGDLVGGEMRRIVEYFEKGDIADPMILPW